MYLEVYPDIIFILNLLIDFVLLFLLKKVNRKRSKLIRMISASAVGSLFAVLVSIDPMIPAPVRFLILNVAAAVLMIRISFGRMKLPELIKQVSVLYLITFFTGGMLNSLYYYTDIRERLIRISNALTFSNLSALYVVVMIICLVPITYAALWFIRWYQSEKRDTYDIELVFQEFSIHTKGLMDTGNCLYDPVFKKPVMVTEDTLIQELLPKQLWEEIAAAKDYITGNDIGKGYPMTDDNALHLRFIPYQSIGQRKGLMLGFMLDKVLIHTERETICNEKVIAAICDNHLSTKDEYHVILHKELI